MMMCVINSILCLYNTYVVLQFFFTGTGSECLGELQCIYASKLVKLTKRKCGLSC